MNKATLQERLFAVADWVERVDANPKFQRAVYCFLALGGSFFAGVIIGMLWR